LDCRGGSGRIAGGPGAVAQSAHADRCEIRSRLAWQACRRQPVTPPGAVATLPLDVTHPATFAGVPATLSRRALQTRLGRRHLFKLALPSHPRVFNATRESWQAQVADHPWLCWTQPELQT